ncbi:MAG: arylesterase [Kiritimatiellia bacterium]
MPRNKVFKNNRYIYFARTLVCITFLALPLASCRASEPRALRITVIGDSLTAGYGLDSQNAFPAQLERALRATGWPVTLNNAGVSGDTTAGGRARLDWVLQDQPDVLIIQLGANDALRGLSPEKAEENLDDMIQRTKARGIKVILAGMQAPRNLGLGYQRAFNPIYPRLAEKHGVPLYPFFLEGVAGNTDLNLADGIHPNAEGIQEIVRRFTPFLLQHF